MSLSSEDVAQGIIDVVDEHMVHALSKVSIQQGFDPKDFTLIPFGGAGPLHMCALAEKLGIKTIIVPYYPGVFSAMGLVMADHIFDATVSLFAGVDEKGLPERLHRMCEEMKLHLQTFFEGENSSKINYEWSVQMRYEGQSHEIVIPLAQASQLDDSVSLFHRRHLQVNGWQKETSPQMVALTGRAIVKTPKNLQRSTPVVPDAVKQDVSVFDRTWQKVSFMARDAVTEQVVGPTLLVQKDATVWMNAHWEGIVDPTTGALVLRKKEAL
jgi:N-methylhydantoinase A